MGREVGRRRGGGQERRSVEREEGEKEGKEKKERIRKGKKEKKNRGGSWRC